MSDEIKSYKMKVFRYERPVPHQSFMVRYSQFQLYGVDKKRSQTHIAEMSTTSKSNVNKLLTGLLLDWDWNYDGEIDIPEDKVKYLRIILQNQRDYTFWRKGLDILKLGGKEKTWEFIEEQVPILELRNRLR